MSEFSNMPQQVVIYCALQYGKASMAKMHAMIDPNDVHHAEMGQRKLGLEDEPHVTLIYGHTVADNVPAIPKAFDVVKEIKHALDFMPRPYAEIGYQFKIFENESFDVVVLKVSSAFAEQLNAFIAARYDVTLNFSYNPHLTIGYLKKGTGLKYDKMYVEHGISGFDVTGIKVAVHYQDDQGGEINDQQFVVFNKTDK